MANENEKFTPEEFFKVLGEIRESVHRIEANTDLLRGEVRILQDMRSNHELRLELLEKKIRENET